MTITSTEQTIAMIYARSENYCIGQNGRLPWHLPDEFAFFEATTRDSAVIMGRRTYEDHSNLLEDRLNILLTSKDIPDLNPAILVASDLDQAFLLGFAQHTTCFVIGGVSLFEVTLPKADIVYESVIHSEFQGDTFLPAFDYTDWQSEVLMTHGTDEHHHWGFTTWQHTRRSYR